jgi:L-2-hydroxycarboxylate dehydrogenase (NAD+)
MPDDTRVESLEFLQYAIARVCQAWGASEEHAAYIAEGIGFAHRQGKLNQGLGVYECIDIALYAGMDPQAVPELTSEGPAMAVFDGKRSSGYYTLNCMADWAIERAKTTGIAIAYGGNHFDGGSFAGYVYKAYEQDMLAFSSNNTVPLAAPIGSRENVLSCPPFDAIAPSGDEAPIWASLKFAEFYDADVAEAVLHNRGKMKGDWCVDTETGEVTEDVSKYAVPIEGYGRLWDYSCAGRIATPRTYALNLWNEAMTALFNPLGIASSELPTIADYDKAKQDGSEVAASVGGSYYICINPGLLGSIDDMKSKSDRFVKDVMNCKTIPGQNIRIPGAKGYQSLRNNEETVEILTSHWDPFFVNIAGQYGLDEAQLRADFSAQ